MPRRLSPTAWLLRLLASIAALVAGCSTQTPQPVKPIASPQPAPSVPPPTPAVLVSQARTAREYRADAARHLYQHNRTRIYQGKLPPLLYAVGVLQVDVDGQGQVSGISWMRAPKHAPEVMAEIERTVRQAAPYPVPVRLGRVTYTDTWLWHKSGNFQLDTLTEGQM